MRSFYILLFLALYSLKPTLSWSTESRKDDGCMKGKCHNNMKKKLKSLRNKHLQGKEDSCAICHNPHENNAPDDLSLKRPLADVCFSCHVELGEKVRTAKYIHTPIRNDLCESCHLSHGGDNPKFLRKWSPPDFYIGMPQPFIDDFMILCWTCHEIGMAKEGKTDGLTDFRNGLKNLHFVHLIQKKGRKCDSCHAIHASDQEFLIRVETPFGGRWRLPIRFTRTETGGNCFVGCHRRRGYDRKSPVINTAPPSQPGVPNIERQ